MKYFCDEGSFFRVAASSNNRINLDAETAARQLCGALCKGKINMMNTILNVAAFIVLLILSFILGLLGKPTEMGLSILAGAIALSFLNIDKIKRFKGAGFEAEMQEKLEAIIEKETEPHKCDDNDFISIKGYGTDENDKKVINALNNPRYTWRYLGGIIKDTALTKSEVLKTLNWLLENNLGKITEGEHGTLWTLSAKGRKIYGNSK